MATKAQIDANRKNAKKSTGPKTAKGKKAVAKNAVKHGLFDQRPTIHGELLADFNGHRQAFLDEWKPVGPTESALADRIASLSWRLKRVVRMETEAIEQLMILAGSDWPDTFHIMRIPLEIRKEMVESGTLLRDLSLGQAVVKDFTNYRVLDRLMLYERRMESSMLKTIKELKKLQTERKAQEAGAAERQSTQENPPARRQKSNLKEQSQFAATLVGASSCLTKDYDDRSPGGTSQNKAKPGPPSGATSPDSDDTEACGTAPATADPLTSGLGVA